MTEGLFCEIYVFPECLQEREKMKPIFSTEQARYQKFASFFIVALGYFARGDARPRLRLWKPPPFKKGGRKLSRLGVAVDVYSLSPLA